MTIVKLFAGACALALASVAQADLYWTEVLPSNQPFVAGQGWVRRAPESGNGPIVDVIATRGPNGIEYTQNQLYWPGQQDPSKRLTPGLTTPFVFQSGAYDLDASASYVYFTLGSANRIVRAPINATNSQQYTHFLTDLRFPFAIDVTEQYLFWSEINSGKVRRSDLDGNNIIDVATLVSSYEIEVEGSYLYMTDTLGKITRMNLDGSAKTTLVTGGGFINGIEVTDQFIYWSDLLGTIRRSDLAGGNQVTLYSGLQSPRGITVAPASVPEPASALLLIGGAAWLLRRRRA